MHVAPLGEFSELVVIDGLRSLMNSNHVLETHDIPSVHLAETADYIHCLIMNMSDTITIQGGHIPRTEQHDVRSPRSEQVAPRECFCRTTIQHDKIQADSNISPHLVSLVSLRASIFDMSLVVITPSSPSLRNTLGGQWYGLNMRPLHHQHNSAALIHLIPLKHP